jgi:hypothetical protein
MAADPEAQTKYIELSIVPIPPDTASSVKSELFPIIQTALRETGQEQLLTSGEIQVEVEKTFPTDEVVVVGLALLSQIALETYKEILLPRLKKRFRVRKKRRRKIKSKK